MTVQCLRGVGLRGALGCGTESEYRFPRNFVMSVLAATSVFVVGCTSLETEQPNEATQVAKEAQQQSLSYISTSPLTLQDAVKLGVLGSSAVRNADLSMAIRNNDIAISRAAYYPELFVSISPTNVDGLVAAGAIGIQYTLYDFGLRAAELRASKSDAQRARYEIYGETNEAVKKTAQSYIALAAASRQIAVASRHSKAIEKLERRVRTRVEIGAASDVDLNEIRIAELDAATRRADAANQRDDALAELSSLVQVGPQSVLSIKDIQRILSVKGADAELNLHEFPLVAARREELDAALHRSDAARAGLFPRIRAQASAGLDLTSGGKATGTGVKIGPDIASTISLGGANRERRKNAKLNVVIAEQNLHEEIRLARLATERARIEYTASQADIVRSRSILKIARQKRDILVSEYEAGTRSLKDLVDAEEEMFQKEQSLVQAYARDLLARLEVLHATNLVSTRLYRPIQVEDDG